MSGKTLVIVPTYDERENLPRLIERVMRQPAPVDLLLVDGNSPDGTGKLADEIAAKNPRVHVLHEKEKAGLGRAYIAGFQWALQRDYEFIMEMDGDISHNPDDIPAFLAAAQNAELVIGSRYSNGIRVINWPLKRLMLSMAAAKYVRIITGMPISDPTGGYRVAYPSNWTVHEGGKTAATIAPQAGTPEISGHPEVVYGAIVNVYSNFGNDAAKKEKDDDETAAESAGEQLDAAFGDLRAQVLSASPYLTKVKGSGRTFRTEDGHRRGFLFTGTNPHRDLGAGHLHQMMDSLNGPGVKG